MAVAPIQVTLTGLTNFSLTLDIFAYEAAQNAAPLVSGLVLTADTQQPDKYWTTTNAGLNGLHTVVIKEGTTIRGRGYVILDDTTSVHYVVGETFIGNIEATTVNIAQLAGTGAFVLTIEVLDENDDPIEGANVGIFRPGDSRQGSTDIDGKVYFNSNNVTWTSVAITAIGFTFATSPITVVGNMTVTFNGASSGALPAPLSSAQVHGIAFTYNEDGAAENGVIVYSQMVLPSTTSGVYDSRINESISSNGIVTILNMFQGAIYRIWRGKSVEPMKIKVPITANSSFNLPPILGMDE